MRRDAAKLLRGGSFAILVAVLGCRLPPAAASEPGALLAVRFECSRCHEGPWSPPAREKGCAGCHGDLLAGRLDGAFDGAALAEWKAHVRSFTAVPSLHALGARLRRDWVEAYLLEPHDVRPGLAETMPRLPLSPDDARALAEWLVKDAPGPPVPPPGDPLRGLPLARTLGCPTCHAFGGAYGWPDGAERADDAIRRRAPDLRHARERMTHRMIAARLADPEAVHQGSLMPRFRLSPAQRADIAAALLRSPLADDPVAPEPARLPILARPVGHAEVHERVFARTCRHCHADPLPVGGDGGPGNTGGFGFVPRGIDLSTRAAILRGDGRGRSLVAPGADGVPRLVRHLLARRSEELGRPVAGIRGMPLALPAVPPEDIRLVESWIAQGCPP